MPRTRAARVVDEMMDGRTPVVWISDRNSAQQPHGERHQTCLAHLARDTAFAFEHGCDDLPLRFKLWLGRAFDLAKGITSFAASTLTSKKHSLEKQLAALLAASTECDLARELQAKIGRARHQLLTFCDFPGEVDVTNNGSERKLRPCVIQRKVTNGYRAMWAAALGRYGVLTADDARNRAREILGSVSAGADPAADIAFKRAAITFADLAERFIDEHVRAKRKSKTAAHYEALLNTHAVPALGKRKAEAITRAEIAQVHSSLGETPYQANRLLAVIGSLFNFAEKHGLVPENRNPARKIEKFPEQRRERFLNSRELERLGAAIQIGEAEGIPWSLDAEKQPSKHLPKSKNQKTVIAKEAATAIRLLMFTGARLREILNLRWEYVDLERGLLFLPDSKTGRKTIVLNQAAINILKAQTQQGPYVIPGGDPNKPRADLQKPWAAVCRHAGLAGLRIHDLRHTFASIGAGASLGLPIVGKLLGHSQPQTTARYAHLDVDPLVQASNLIGNHILSAFDGASNAQPSMSKEAHESDNVVS